MKGLEGDAMNALLCGVVHNLRKILRRLAFLLCAMDGSAAIGMPETDLPSSGFRLKFRVFQ